MLLKLSSLYGAITVSAIKADRSNLSEFRSSKLKGSKLNCGASDLDFKYYVSLGLVSRVIFVGQEKCLLKTKKIINNVLFYII